MRFEKLQAGQEVALETFLKSHAYTSMFLRGNLATSGLAGGDGPCHGDYLAALTSSNEIVGVLAHYWNDNIMMQCPELDVLDKLVETFCQSKPRKVGGVLGKPDQVSHVIAGLGLNNAEFALDAHEGLYALPLADLKMPAFDDTSFKLVGTEKIDAKILFDWMKSYDIEALGSTDNEALDTRITQSVETMKKPGGHRRVLLENGTPVSLCGLNSRLPDIVQIGPVWTPTELRSNGYARIGVALMLLEARAQNVPEAILFTDIPAAIKSYEALGFARFDSYRLALLKTPMPIGKTG